MNKTFSNSIDKQNRQFKQKTQYIQLLLISQMNSKIIRESDQNIPSFLKITFEILNNPKYQSIITWDQNGKFIKIKDVHNFQLCVLPIHFRHKHTSSFIRQLNLYGFKKVKKSISQNSFSHPEFTRDNADGLNSIYRKIQKKKKIKKILWNTSRSSHTSDKSQSLNEEIQHQTNIANPPNIAYTLNMPQFLPYRAFEQNYYQNLSLIYNQALFYQRYQNNFFTQL